jgi:hypothetical protein
MAGNSAHDSSTAASVALNSDRYIIDVRRSTCDCATTASATSAGPKAAT